MFKVSNQSLKSYFAYTYTDFKKTMGIGIIICACMLLVQVITTLVFSLVAAGSSNSNSGMLMVAYVTLGITFMIGVIADTSNGHMRNLFRFPINRPTYALGNLIYFFIVPLAIIAVVSLFQVLETLSFAIMSALLDKLIYVNTISVSAYLEGIIPSYVTIIYAMSLIYVLFMYFHRFKLPFVIVLTVAIFAYIFIGGFRVAFNKAFLYPFRLKSMVEFSLYMVGVSLGFHILAFVPLKVMEVKS